MKILRRHLLSLLLLLIACPVWAAPAKEDVVAAMVYRLTKFVEWPDSAQPSLEAPFQICFDESSKVYDKLVSAKLNTWRGREVVVKLEVSAACHVLVSSAMPPPEYAHTLLIGVAEGFLQSGGHIEISFERGRLALQVNRTAAMDNGLSLSSELLSLARTVL